jgi:nucleoside-diphosphate-sugar epimerase
VADKSMPMTSSLNEDHKAAFDKKEVVEFSQCDLTRDAHIEKAFKDYEFDYVVNCCGETRFGMAEQEYKMKCVEPVNKAVPAAIKNKVKKWVELSTAQVYKPSSKPCDEKAPVDPWTLVAKYRQDAETSLTKAADGKLNYVILRPAYVYGAGDLNSITPRIVCAATYTETKEKMKFLWASTLKLNTVHVDDVCTAIWRSCTTYESGSIFNLADPSNVDQGTINKHLGSMFGVSVGFYGSTVSKMTGAIGMAAVARASNDKHVPVWTKLCQKHDILNTPLSPYLDQELLRNNSLCIDGSTITKADKEFTYTHKACTEDELRSVVEGYIKQKIFPPILKEKK